LDIGAIYPHIPFDLCAPWIIDLKIVDLRLGGELDAFGQTGLRKAVKSEE
jgi:hypothetical protein